MTQSGKNLLFLFVCFLGMSAACLGAYIAGYGNAFRDASVPTIQRDTVTTVDTVIRERPTFLYERICDTLVVCCTDTLRDTVIVQLPITTREYADSSYRAIISGYRPTLDWIEVYPKTVTIRETETARKQRKVSFGTTIGPALVLTPDGSVKGGLGVAAGVSIAF